MVGNFLYRIQQKVLNNPLLFKIVLLVNFIGTLYGFYWYRYQLAQTPLYFWIFTPDCPGAAFLFILWVLIFSLKKPYHPLFKVIAITALIKYGIWTVSVIGLFWIDHGIFIFEMIILFISHIGMIIEGSVFSAKMRIDRLSFGVTTLWLILNDFIDYYYQVHPWLPDYGRLGEIRFGTFVLTGIIIIWMYQKLKHTST